MGMQYEAVCAACGTHFAVSEGGGFCFHLLRCDACGLPRSIGFEEIGEPHLRYLKGLKVPYSGATAEHDREVQRTYRGKPLGERDYRAAVEQLCGTCECGGRFRFEAPVRCPHCRGEYRRTGAEPGLVMYD